MSELISNFYSDDASKKAEVYLDAGLYYIKLYEDIPLTGMTLVGIKEFPNNALYYVENAAENYVLGV